MPNYGPHGGGWNNYPPGDAYNEQPPAPTPKKSRAKWWLLFVVLVVAIIAGCVALTFASADKDKNGTFAPKNTVTAQAQTSGPGKDVGKAAGTAASKAPVKVAAIGAGEFTVGKHVQAGEYRSAGAAESLATLCYWLVTKDGTVNTVIDQGAVNGVNEPSSVTLKNGQHFKSTGCKPWIRQ